MGVSFAHRLTPRFRWRSPAATLTAATTTTACASGRRASFENFGGSGSARQCIGFVYLLLALALGLALTAPPRRRRTRRQGRQAPPKPAQIDRNGVLMLVPLGGARRAPRQHHRQYTCCATSARRAFNRPTRPRGSARSSPICAGANFDLTGVVCSIRQLTLLPQIETSGMNAHGRLLSLGAAPGDFD